MIAGKDDHAYAAAAREHGLVAFGEFNIAGAGGNDEHLEERERGRHDLELPPLRGIEQGRNRRKEALVLLDEIDENRRVDADRPGAEMVDQRQAARSRATWEAPSTSRHSSLPSPRNSRIDKAAGGSSALVSRIVTSCATERRSRLARALSWR